MVNSGEQLKLVEEAAAAGHTVIVNPGPLTASDDFARFLEIAPANSSGRCNNDFKSISRRLVTECLARPRVETHSHRVKVSLTVA